MPIVQISMLEGRKPEQIRNLIHDVAQTVSNSLQVPIDSIKVIVTEVPTTHWGSGGLTIAEKRSQNP